MADSRQELDQLVAAVRGSGKYAGVSEALIRKIGARELSRQPRLKEAIKTTRGQLHQVGGAYLASRIDYAAALEDLCIARRSESDNEWRAACLRLMRHHASTRERLPILDPFYRAALGDLGPIHSILDLACGLNPLAVPWMPLAEGAEYHACDIYEDMIDFLNRFLALAGVRGEASVTDLTQTVPHRPVQIALLLKSMPCLDQLDPDAGRRLLHGLNAEHLLISFPVHSLGGRQKGMIAHYAARFQELTAGTEWRVRRYEFATELLFRLSR
jgi:16S rRNA (guanine(1405)-N(7))-methyltransferase